MRVNVLTLVEAPRSRNTDSLVARDVNGSFAVAERVFVRVADASPRTGALPRVLGRCLLVLE